MNKLFTNTGTFSAAETTSLSACGRPHRQYWQLQPHRRHQLTRCRTLSLFAKTYIVNAAWASPSPTLPTSPTSPTLSWPPAPANLGPASPTSSVSPTSPTSPTLAPSTYIVNCRQPTNQCRVVNIIVGPSAIGHIARTSAFSLITSYMGPYLRRLPTSQPSWWGNVLISGSFPFDLSPVSSGLLAHYKQDPSFSIWGQLLITLSNAYIA